MNNLIKKQLESVEIADLSHFNPEDNTYFIPQKKSIKIERNKSYLIYVTDSFFYNKVLQDNWNKGRILKDRYIKADIDDIVGKMIKVTCIGYDVLNKKDTNNFWNGWLPLDNIQVLQKL